MMRLRGKAAIVTGAAGAIGGAIARRLAEDGCAVGLVDRAPCRAAADEIGASGGRATDHAADISDARAVAGAVAAAEAEFGGLDILVNAAGVTSFGAAATLDEAEWDRVMAANLKGVFLACQAAIGPMRRRGGGRIVNIGSVLAKNGGNARPWIDRAEQERASNVAYGVSKAGVHAMTLYLARELAADGITVNAVAPGPIESAMTATFPDRLKALIPLGRLGRPDEVAEAVAFLCGEKAGFITGEIIDVNGGSWPD